MASPLNFQYSNSFAFPTTQGFSQTSLAGAQASGFGALNGAGGIAGMMQVLQQMLMSLSQLSQGWNGFVGTQPWNQPQPWTQPQPTPNYIPTGPYIPTPDPTPPVTGGGGLYGGGGGGPAAVGAPPVPPLRDPGDYNSYLAAQVAGGALSGNTTVRQSDMIPGTRFAQVRPAQLWHANVGRLYAYQFAAQASGLDPLSPQGLAGGAQALQQMRPEAALFAQVASVFKGNLMGGPGFYDNPGLKNLLISVGRSDLTGTPGVGQTDVQTVGAITRAIQEGSLTLDQVIKSGTIDNLNRYQQVIQYVSGGQFSLDLNAYDNIAI